MTTTNEYGYVDDEGNVFLNSPSGAAKIGQYAAGEPNEGLECLGLEDLGRRVRIPQQPLPVRLVDDGDAERGLHRESVLEEGNRRLRAPRVVPRVRVDEERL